MAPIFATPPIVELISEVRWGPPTLGVATARGQVQIQGEAPTPNMGIAIVSNYEDFFMQFAIKAHEMGFTIRERIVPADSVVMPHQVIWRWKMPNKASPLIQLGIGVFTVNGSPPDYKSWGEFSESLKMAIDGLMTALDSYPNGKPAKIGQTLLRYIDSFGDDLTEGAQPLEFIGNTLGINIGIPKVIAKLSTDTEKILPTLRLTVPVKDGTLEIVTAKAVVAGKDGILFDTTVIKSSEADFTSDNIFALFNSSHEITHEVFLELTRTLHEKMGIKYE